MFESARWRFATLAVALAAVALYLPFAAPGLQFGDSAELQTIALLGGVPHSSGYPLYVLVARLFTAVLPGAPEFRATLVSVLSGAAALALFMPVMRRLGAGIAPAALAALSFGLSFTFWRAAHRAEVYTLTVAVAMLALHRALVATGEGRFRDAALAGFLMGLTLCGHLSFIPVMAAGGLALAWHVLRRHAHPVPKLAALLGAFVLGLAPYLYLAWADAHRAPVNFLALVDHARALMPPGGPPFEHPLDRLRWLVFGRNVYPPRPFSFEARTAALALLQCGAIVFLFELGPAALAAFVAGARSLWRRHRSVAGWIAAALAASALFTAALASSLHGPALLHLFMLPATLLAALASGLGLEAGAAALRARGVRGAAGAAAWLAMAALLVVPPAVIRAWADTHPLGPWEWKVTEEDKSLRAGLVPSMRGYREPEEYGRSALAAMPLGALVLAHWTEFAALRHLQVIEHLRPDVTLDQVTVETVRARIRQWRAAHPGGGAPIVFTSHGISMDPFASEVDSFPVATGRFLYVLRGDVSADSAR